MVLATFKGLVYSSEFGLNTDGSRGLPSRPVVNVDVLTFGGNMFVFWPWCPSLCYKKVHIFDKKYLNIH